MNSTVNSQGLKGFNLGEISSEKILHTIAVEGMVGDLLISTLKDGRIWRLFFVSDFNTRFVEIDSDDFISFGKSLNSNLNLSLQECEQTDSGKPIDGEWNYREFRDNKNGVRYLLRFGNINDESVGNEIYFWITDEALVKINKIEKSNSN